MLLGGWHRDGHYKGSVNVLGDFSKPDLGLLFTSVTVFVSNKCPFLNLSRVC